MKSRITAVGRRLGVEGLSKKEKGLNNVVTAEGKGV